MVKFRAREYAYFSSTNRILTKPDIQNTVRDCEIHCPSCQDSSFPYIPSDQDHLMLSQHTAAISTNSLFRRILCQITPIEQPVIALRRQSLQQEQ